MYEKIKERLTNSGNGKYYIIIAILLLCCLWLGTSDRSDGHSAYNSAGQQLRDTERDRQTIETGLAASQQTVNGVSDRLRDSQQTIYRAEDRQLSTENLFRECEQIVRELKRRAESRETQK